MIRIQIEYASSSGLLDAFYAVKHLDVEAPTVAGPVKLMSLLSNDTGTTFFCDRINGEHSPCLLFVKLFTFRNDGLEPAEYTRLLDVQRNLAVYYRLHENHLERPFSQEIFRAIPQLVFKGRIEGLLFYGYAGLALDADWITLRNVRDSLTHPVENAEFFQMAPEIKIAMARELVTGFSWLQACALTFIDGTDEQLAVNYKTGKAAFLDYEKLYQLTQETPTTGLSLSPWSPPELIRSLNNDQDSVTPMPTMGYYALATLLAALFIPGSFYPNNPLTAEIRSRLTAVPERSRSAIVSCLFPDHPGMGTLPTYSDWFNILADEPKPADLGASEAGEDPVLDTSPLPQVDLSVDSDPELFVPPGANSEGLFETLLASSINEYLTNLHLELNIPACLLEEPPTLVADLDPLGGIPDPPAFIPLPVTPEAGLTMLDQALQELKFRMTQQLNLHTLFNGK
ncbi:hypothetical protein ACS5NO_28150 [Larkinella sp. GY13]|uniref:hypothetical protein n=1 Tax=Larkinella sp. GY13 TaxID=3453720 RepID=UPI003EEB10CB